MSVKMSKRLSRDELFSIYPNQYLTITNIEFEGAKVLSAEVLEHSLTRDEAFAKQIDSNGKIEMFSTMNNSFMSVGLFG